MERTKTDIVVLRTFTDDHIYCAEVQYIEDNVLKTRELWWCGWEGIAAAKYANESDKAYTDFEEAIKVDDEMRKDCLTVVVPGEEEWDKSKD